MPQDPRSHNRKQHGRPGSGSGGGRGKAGGHDGYRGVGRGAPQGGSQPGSSKSRGSGAPRTSQPDGDAGAKRVTRRRDLKGAAANLPTWIIEDLARVTPAKRVPAALEALGEASEALADGAYHKAVKKALLAKDLAPRDVTVRETLALAAYRTGDWKTALTELRTFRRLAGETTHLPVEMDVLRAMGRNKDVEAAWKELRTRGGRPAVIKEGKVVFASHLVDQGDLDTAWELTDPGTLPSRVFPEDLRVWYVAARVAALRHDAENATRLRNAILEHDPAFPGIDELERLIASA